MKLPHSLLFVFLLTAFMTSGSFSFAQKTKQKYAFNNIKKVVKTPYRYEFPVQTTSTKSEGALDKAWVVYSDRNNNATYTDEKLISTLQKVNLLDSFYVIKEGNEALELVKCVSGLVAKNSIGVQDPNKIEYCGWIEKSKLLLSQKSFLDATNRRPLKSITVLGGRGIFEKVKNYTEGTKIKVFDSPEFNQVLNKELLFDEIVYVYKFYKDKVLIGRKPSFSTKEATSVVMGWVPLDFVQSWGQRLCIEPLDNLPAGKTPALVYLTKDQASLSPPTLSLGFPLNEQGCGISQNKKKKLPVLKTETLTKGTTQYGIIHTGALTNTTDRSKSFVYNINGNKINYGKLCDLTDKSKQVNIVFAINGGNDTKEFLNVLISTLQELSGFFMSQKNTYSFRFGATDCANYYTTSSLKTGLSEQYSDILPSLINIVRSSVENKGNVPTSIIHGLNNATKLLKGHEDESNVIIMISSQADNASLEASTKVLKESVMEDIAKNNARLLFLQPFCGSAPSYSNFVQQAKSIIKTSSDAAMPLRKEKLIGNNLSELPQNSFRTVISGTNNVYCLDYPQNAYYQGFLLFPTIGNKIDDKYLDDALDSLLQQIQTDNMTLSLSISNAFNSPSSFNNSIGGSFKRYYPTQEPLPTDVGFYFKNIEYSYFVNGYVAYPKGTNMSKPFKYNLLLSSDEYEELHSAFKSLHFDLLPPQYDLKTRTATYQSVSQVLKRYAIERKVEIPDYISLSKFFNVTGGYWPDNIVLSKFKISDLKSTTVKKEDFKTVIDHVNARLAVFYGLRNNSQYTFSSNGILYYWIPEEALP